MVDCSWGFPQAQSEREKSEEIVLKSSLVLAPQLPVVGTPGDSQIIEDLALGEAVGGKVRGSERNTVRR